MDVLNTARRKEYVSSGSGSVDGVVNVYIGDKTYYTGIG
jgi:hypothetical protein